jgi:Ca2+-binding RTX toxin-like protein
VRKLTTALVIAAIAATTGSGQAGAATARVNPFDSTILEYLAYSGEANSVTITLRLEFTYPFRRYYEIVDTGITNMQVQSGCTRISGTEAECTTSGITRIIILLEDLGDALTLNNSIGPLPAQIWGGAGDDTVLGGAGNDQIGGYESGNDTLDGRGGDDVVRGLSGDDILRGGDGNDAVDSGDVGSGNDQIEGGEGNDLLGGANQGNDTFSGGGGTDTIDFQSGSGVAAVTVDLAAGAITGAGSDTVSGVENLLGTSGPDVFRGDAAANVLDGRGGNDLLVGRGGSDSLTGGSGMDTADYSAAPAGVTVNLGTGVVAGDGNDTVSGIEKLIGSPHADTLVGGDGDDTFAGRGGADTIIGSVGNDTAEYENAPAGVVVNLASGEVTGGDGNDTLSAIEALVGSSHDDDLTGNGEANSLAGRLGKDVLAGAGGDDTLDGGEDEDTADYSAAPVGVTADLGAGSATGEGGDTLTAIENLIGSELADVLTGSSSVNTLAGGGGNDIIRSRDGGFDVDICGAGIDSVVADAQDATTADCEAVDTGASPGGAAAAADTTAPSVTLTIKARQKLLRALRKGLRATAGCSETCALQAKLLLAPKLAKKLKLPIVVGKATANLAAAGTTNLVVKFTAKAKRKLAKLRSVRVTLEVVATDAAANAATARKAVTLKR